MSGKALAALPPDERKGYAFPEGIEIVSEATPPPQRGIAVEEFAEGVGKA